MDPYIIIIVASLFFWLCGLILFRFFPAMTYVQALSSGLMINPLYFFAWRFQRIPAELMINSLIKVKKAGIGNIPLNELESLYLSNGNLKQVLDAYIIAHFAGLEITFADLAAIDLAGKNVEHAVTDYVQPKTIFIPAFRVYKDGVQLGIEACLTVQSNPYKVIGSVSDSTIIARTKQNIQTAISGIVRWEIIFENLDQIAQDAIELGLLAGTSYFLNSLEISAARINKSYGAVLSVENAEAEMKIALAKAAEKSATARADLFIQKAKVTRQRSRYIRSKSYEQLALADAIRQGFI